MEDGGLKYIRRQLVSKEKTQNLFDKILLPIL
nr:MAG TPA: hypothetical protein [Caudoviricetes sp.]